MPSRAPPYADEEVELERERATSPPLYVVAPYTEAQVSGKKLKSSMLVHVGVLCLVDEFKIR
jgi:hypothetical protein